MDAVYKKVTVVRSIRLAFIAALTGVAAIASQLRAAEPATPIVPEDWLPALSPSISSALSQLKDANTQAEMNSLSRQVADMTDAQLFVAYVRLYERLSAAERKKLHDEQTRWLKQRAKAAREGVESKGGSLAPLEANNAEVTFTEKRLAELRARFKALGSDDTTPARATAVDEETAPKRKKKSSAAEEPTPRPAKKKKTAPAQEDE